MTDNDKVTVNVNQATLYSPIHGTATVFICVEMFIK